MVKIIDKGAVEQKVSHLLEEEKKLSPFARLKLLRGKGDKMKDFSHTKKFKNKMKDKMFPDRAMLINMQMRNGMHRTFFIKPKKGHFTYMRGMYIIDTELRYYNIDAKMYSLDYHQEFPLPIKRNLDPNELKKAVKSSGIYEIENALNPSVLQGFLESKIAEGVMQAQQIDKFLKSMRFMGLITLVVVMAHMLLFMFKTGMLQSLGNSLPF